MLQVALVATLACAAASYSGYYPVYGGAYAYSPAHITVLPSGYLADTPEVAASKVTHEAAKASAAAAAAASPDLDSYSHSYVAPVYLAPFYAGAYAHAPADIQVLPSGYLADTPEVTAAKTAHFAEQAKAAAAAAASPEHPVYYGYH